METLNRDPCLPYGSNRFATIEPEEFQELLKQTDSENRQQRSPVVGAKIFRAYLASKGLSTNFEEFEKKELADTLAKFYVEARREDGKPYKTGTQLNIRASLNRHLKNTSNRPINIISEAVFFDANLAFSANQEKLRKEGYGDTVSIDKSDIAKLYTSGVFNEDTPEGLQNKVWFELMLYINVGGLGRDKLRMLERDHFSIAADSNGRRYVYQAKDNMTKKIQDKDCMTSKAGGGRMYETQTKWCPVASFEKYISKLYPYCNALFQVPIMINSAHLYINKPWWYKNSPVGVKTLGSFMPKLSLAAGLSRGYTNHSLKSTSMTILDESAFATKDTCICSVSGLLSESSVKTCIGPPNNIEKKQFLGAFSLSISQPVAVPNEAEDITDDKPSTSCGSPSAFTSPSAQCTTHAAAVISATGNIDGEVQMIPEQTDSDNTHRSTVSCAKVFKAYLASKGLPTNFEEFGKKELADVLVKFYVEARREDGERYKAGSLTNIRAGLNRHLKNTGLEINIITEPIFALANHVFSANQEKLKKEGYGGTKHYAAIDASDVVKLYESGVFNEDTPEGLQNKVWFELMLYFGNRGRDKLRMLERDHFSVATDSDGRRYVYEANDELTSKRNQDDDSMKSTADVVKMYETRRKWCPVASFEKYISKLNPHCSALFQVPGRIEMTPWYKGSNDRPWYKNIPVSEKTLGSFMTKLSTAAGLMKCYTNYSLKFTSVAVLDSVYTARDIWSGHRNEYSVMIFSGPMPYPLPLSLSISQPVSEPKEKGDVTYDKSSTSCAYPSASTAPSAQCTTFSIPGNKDEFQDRLHKSNWTLICKYCTRHFHCADRYRRHLRNHVKKYQRRHSHQTVTTEGTTKVCRNEKGNKPSPKSEQQIKRSPKKLICVLCKKLAGQKPRRHFMTIHDVYDQAEIESLYKKSCKLSGQPVRRTRCDSVRTSNSYQRRWKTCPYCGKLTKRMAEHIKASHKDYDAKVLKRVDRRVHANKASTSKVCWNEKGNKLATKSEQQIRRSPKVSINQEYFIIIF
ncbi:uncharacterized protein [Amphiura filiformis]|uniref:uncharacterized protein n=1 Tax=Amphiura filiformis TaxID=82378 RepID=UPI003B21D7B4